MLYDLMIEGVCNVLPIYNYSVFCEKVTRKTPEILLFESILRHSGAGKR